MASKHVYALNQDPDPHPLRSNVEILEEMLNMVLKNNIFEFNGDYFLQLQGTAMGTKMIPAYANLFMGSLEPDLTNLGHPHILLWRQYIDDIFLIWTGSNSQLEKFMENINHVHPTIKFTHEQIHKIHIKPTNNYTSIKNHTTQTVSKQPFQKVKR